MVRITLIALGAATIASVATPPVHALEISMGYKKMQLQADEGDDDKNLEEDFENWKDGVFWDGIGGEPQRGAKRRAGNTIITRGTARSEATSIDTILS